MSSTNTRQPLTDGGGWFNPSTSELFEEDGDWDGNNRISCATGSQWDHERLYRTKSKRWILHHWSQWQGSIETHHEIHDDDAAQWLLTNGETHPDAEQAISAMEI